jgi:uncharacterized damage-inducible protein DinB
MNTIDIKYIFDYNRWANKTILEVVSRLTPEQFTKDLHSSHRSVRDTIVHILAAEWIWLERWKGVSPKALLDPADFPNVESVTTRLSEVADDTGEFIHGLTDEALTHAVTYTNTKGEKWTYSLGQMMQHVANHSSYHRGQVATMLRQLGVEPSAVDLLVFVDVLEETTA